MGFGNIGKMVSKAAANVKSAAGTAAPKPAAGGGGGGGGMMGNMVKAAMPAIKKAVESRPTTTQAISKALPAKAAQAMSKMMRKGGGSITTTKMKTAKPSSRNC